VIIQADRNTDSLIALYYHPLQHAEDGGHGQGKQQTGRTGKDILIRVPCGTEIRDEPTGKPLADLIDHDEQMIIARGGRGGLGNCHFKTSTHRTPLEHTDGEPGEEKKVRLDLKIVADVGLIGFPNAGKSTLLGAISHAHPKIASYPFTTLNPIIGTLRFELYTDITIVDIPGLIQGAHRGDGLGHAFLRHVERTRFLIFVIDMAGTDNRHPADDYAILMNELGRHSPDLIRRPALIVANKMDIEDTAHYLSEFMQRTGKKPLAISAKNGQGLEAVKQALFDELIKKKQRS